ncbi:low molecular weight phosphotyrosine protein phosphatase [Phycicoccus sp. CSK15P-2]|uniref:low molecular weight protein-tyrosine-phosphatase n=1 Tax=Phycicoccus sp. CSK15P-2 TaxID=2807627 RepID=UPI00194F2DDD|nr:low molecular weight protein-tyrosine-phosphatase [Phycicoccus sp. CSK15P-2]MBM6403390.1 low molecular weight phosphotyrosine protein phosphatase [Phycicoccus sp. CSK15P-2]
MSQRRYRVTTVCHGNICRSPMAEMMLREALEDAGLGDRVDVDSAGVSSEELGHGMDHRALETLRRHGHPDVGWSAHTARQIDAEWLGDADLVLAADHPHVARLEQLAGSPQDARKVALIRSFDPASAAEGDLGMADPWWGDDTDFDETHAQIAAALPGIVEHVRGALDGH